MWTKGEWSEGRKKRRYPGNAVLNVYYLKIRGEKNGGKYNTNRQGLNRDMMGGAIHREQGRWGSKGVVMNSKWIWSQEMWKEVNEPRGRTAGTNERERRVEPYCKGVKGWGRTNRGQEEGLRVRKWGGYENLAGVIRVECET